jgi:hypothetical protein
MQLVRYTMPEAAYLYVKFCMYYPKQALRCLTWTIKYCDCVSSCLENMIKKNYNMDPPFALHKKQYPFGRDACAACNMYYM